MIITNSKVYDNLKLLAQVILPALGSLYFGLAGIWGLPSAEEIVGSILLIDTFLGVILQISSGAYSKGIEEGGELHVNDGQLLFQLDEDKTDITKLGDKSEVRFKVKKVKGGET